MWKHPRWIGFAIIAVLGLTVMLAGGGCTPYVAPVEDEAAPEVQGSAGDNYLFCFWNLENFFDDKVDGYGRSPDKEYDRWFGEHPEVLKQKLHNISKVIAGLNDGRGPDILAVAEVETTRAAELLMQELNQRLPKGVPPYKHLLMEEVDGGRHIATAIITRLPVEGDRTQLLGKRQRILEGHLVVNGHELVVIASHWTSRVSDKEGEGRDRYASQIYGRFHAMHKKNPDIAFLICGDFNDDPTDDSVKDALHATDDRATVRRSAGEPLLLDLLMGKDPQAWGTHNYRGHWHIFDHIVISPGLLGGKGWSCDPDSVKVIRDKTADRRGRPDDFGSEHDKIPLDERGYSDHFPVTVRLKVEGK